MSETKKEAFRRYLESAGAIDTLTKVLVNLYEEPDRPLKANDYIKKALGSPTPEDYEKVVAENKRLQAELEAVREQLSELQQVSAPEATEPAEVTE